MCGLEDVLCEGMYAMQQDMLRRCSGSLKEQARDKTRESRACSVQIATCRTRTTHLQEEKLKRQQRSSKKPGTPMDIKVHMGVQKEGLSATEVFLAQSPDLTKSRHLRPRPLESPPPYTKRNETPFKQGLSVISCPHLSLASL